MDEICGLVSACECVCAHLYAHACGGRRLISGIILNPPYLLKAPGMLSLCFLKLESLPALEKILLKEGISAHLKTRLLRQEPPRPPISRHLPGAGAVSRK